MLCKTFGNAPKFKKKIKSEVLGGEKIMAR